MTNRNFALTLTWAPHDSKIVWKTKGLCNSSNAMTFRPVLHMNFTVASVCPLLFRLSRFLGLLNLPDVIGQFYATTFVLGTRGNCAELITVTDTGKDHSLI